MTTTITPENVREMLMNAARAFKNQFGESCRQCLLEILRNNDPNTRDVLATCVHEEDAIGAFTSASSRNDVEVLQAFHDVGMHVDVKDRNGFCALRNACYSSHEECVRWLLDHDANIEIQSNSGSTPLTFASICGNIANVEMLLQRNANIDFQNKYGKTALMYASENERNEIVQLLLSYNANIDLKDDEGKTALDLAKIKEIKELLLNHVNTNYVLK